MSTTKLDKSKMITLLLTGLFVITMSTASGTVYADDNNSGGSSSSDSKSSDSSGSGSGSSSSSDSGTKDNSGSGSGSGSGSQDTGNDKTTTDQTTTTGTTGTTTTTTTTDPTPPTGQGPPVGGGPPVPPVGNWCKVHHCGPPVGNWWWCKIHHCGDGHHHDHDRKVIVVHEHSSPSKIIVTNPISNTNSNDANLLLVTTCTADFNTGQFNAQTQALCDSTITMMHNDGLNGQLPQVDLYLKARGLL